MLSEKAITAHNVATMEKTGSVELPSDKKPIYESYYYYEEEREEETTEKEETDSSNEGEGEAPPEDS